MNDVDKIIKHPGNSPNPFNQGSDNINNPPVTIKLRLTFNYFAAYLFEIVSLKIKTL